MGATNRAATAARSVLVCRGTAHLLGRCSCSMAILAAGVTRGRWAGRSRSRHVDFHNMVRSIRCDDMSSSSCAHTHYVTIPQKHRTRLVKLNVCTPTIPTLPVDLQSIALPVEDRRKRLCTSSFLCFVSLYGLSCCPCFFFETNNSKSRATARSPQTVQLTFFRTRKHKLRRRVPCEVNPKKIWICLRNCLAPTEPRTPIHCHRMSIVTKSLMFGPCLSERQHGTLRGLRLVDFVSERRTS